MGYQYTQHNLWSSIERGLMPFSLHSSQRPTRSSTLTINRTGRRTIGAASLVIVCVFLFVLKGGPTVAPESSVGFSYFMATTKVKAPLDEYRDVYNETLGVRTFDSGRFTMWLLTIGSSRRSSWFRCPNVLTDGTLLLFKQGCPI